MVYYLWSNSRILQYLHAKALAFSAPGIVSVGSLPFESLQIPGESRKKAICTFPVAYLQYKTRQGGRSSYHKVHTYLRTAATQKIELPRPELSKRSNPPAPSTIRRDRRFSTRLPSPRSLPCISQSSVDPHLPSSPVSATPPEGPYFPGIKSDKAYGLYPSKTRWRPQATILIHCLRRRSKGSTTTTLTNLPSPHITTISKTNSNNRRFSSNRLDNNRHRRSSSSADSRRRSLNRPNPRSPNGNRELSASDPTNPRKVLIAIPIKSIFMRLLPRRKLKDLTAKLTLHWR